MGKHKKKGSKNITPRFVPSDYDSPEISKTGNSATSGYQLNSNSATPNSLSQEIRNHSTDDRHFQERLSSNESQVSDGEDSPKLKPCIPYRLTTDPVVLLERLTEDQIKQTKDWVSSKDAHNRLASSPSASLNGSVSEHSDESYSKDVLFPPDNFLKTDPSPEEDQPPLDNFLNLGLTPEHVFFPPDQFDLFTDDLFHIPIPYPNNNPFEKRELYDFSVQDLDTFYKHVCNITSDQEQQKFGQDSENTPDFWININKIPLRTYINFLFYIYNLQTSNYSDYTDLLDSLPSSLSDKLDPLMKANQHASNLMLTLTAGLITTFCNIKGYNPACSSKGTSPFESTRGERDEERASNTSSFSDSHSTKKAVSSKTTQTVSSLIDKSTSTDPPHGDISPFTIPSSSNDCSTMTEIFPLRIDASTSMDFDESISTVPPPGDISTTTIASSSNDCSTMTEIFPMRTNASTSMDCLLEEPNKLNSLPPSPSSSDSLSLQLILREVRELGDMVRASNTFDTQDIASRESPAKRIKRKKTKSHVTSEDPLAVPSNVSRPFTGSARIFTNSTYQDKTNYESRLSTKSILFHVPSNVSEQEIISTIQSYLFCPPESITLKRWRSKQPDSFHWVVQSPKSGLPPLLRKGYVYLGSKRCPLKRFVKVSRCYKCQGYDHIAKHCTNYVVCPRCGEDHSESECKSSNYFCTACSYHNCLNKQGKLYPTSHAANSPLCPVFNLILKARQHSVAHNPPFYPTSLDIITGNYILDSQRDRQHNVVCT